jgi:hypothetical protein
MQVEHNKAGVGAPVITWPAPAGEAPSPDFHVSVSGTPVFVYQARVRAEILKNEGLWTHVHGCPGERASFVIFDMRAPVTVRVKPARAFKTAAVLPECALIAPRLADGVVEFTLREPRKVTVLLDGDDSMALHIFAGKPEENIPSPDDPNVLYIGPGVHETTGVELKSGQTLYLAGGAVLRARLKEKDTQGVYNEKWKVKFYSGTIFKLANVKDVCIRGRGIVDASLIPHPGCPMLVFDGARRVRVEGITLRDTANWNFVIGKSEDIEVCDIRIISGRLNSDGINSVNARRVHVSDCFVRNHDDSIVVKTTTPGMPSEDILVEKCTVWNDWGYALGVTYETRSDVRRVVFRDNAVIHARHWCFGIRVSDSGTVEDITFADTAISDLTVARNDSRAVREALTRQPVLLHGAIVEDCWGHDTERGRIRNVLLDGVTVYGARLPASELHGVDENHDIRGVTFRNVCLAGSPPITDIAALRITRNEFVRDVRMSSGV